MGTQLYSVLGVQVYCIISTNLSIIQNKPIDRETKSEYYVPVTAIDGGSPPKSTQCSLKIRVKVSSSTLQI